MPLRRGSCSCAYVGVTTASAIARNGHLEQRGSSSSLRNGPLPVASWAPRYCALGHSSLRDGCALCSSHLPRAALRSEEQ
eukprot:3069800-Alexandrium_andersonii.AAC.1